MNFLGLDLSKIPQQNMTDYTVYIIPVLYILSSFVSIRITTAKQQKDKEDKKSKNIDGNTGKEIEEENCDVAIGSRFANEKKPHSLRMLGSNLISFCIKITTWKKIKDTTSGMRAYNKKAIKEFITNTSLTPEPDTIVYMIKKGLNVQEVQVEMKEREFGESYLNAFKSIEYMLSMMFSIVFIRAITRKK